MGRGGLQEGVHTALGFGGGVRIAAGRDEASRLQPQEEQQGGAYKAPLAWKYSHSCGKSPEAGGGAGGGGVLKVEGGGC